METRNKYRKGVVLSIGLVFFFIMANLAFAKLVTFEEKYAYQASEYDSKVSCRVLALEQVKRLLLEKLGTYLESETEVKNFQLTKDQIVILTAGIVRTEIIDEKWDGQTYYLKAKIQADPGEIAKSIESLRHDREKTKELEGVKKKADELLKEAERLKNELKIARAEKSDQARKDYDEAIKGLSAVDWLRIGLSLISSGSHKDAIDAFNKAINLNPQFSLAYYIRGTVYFDLKEYRQAIRNLDKAIELEPNFAVAYNNRGLAYRALGDYRQAISNFDKAIELRTDFEPAYYNRGLAYNGINRDIKDKQQAIKDFSRAIELNPKNADSYDNRGLIYLALGDWQHGIKDLDMYIKLNPKNPDIYIRRSFAYIILGDYRQAIRDCDKVIELNPKSVSGYYNRAICYLNLKDYQQAIRDCNRAIELNPKKGEAYHNLGAAYWGLGDYQQAKKNIQIAAKLGSSEAQKFLNEELSEIYWFKKGLSFLESENYKDAINAFRKAIELSPDFREAYFFRAAAHGALGDKQKGREDLKMAAKLGYKQAQDILKSTGIQW